MIALKSLQILVLSMFFALTVVEMGFAETYKPYPEQTVEFSKENSYELAEVIERFALPKEYASIDWIGIKEADKFTNLYKLDNIPQSKDNKYSYQFGGMMGILFNQQGLNEYKGYPADAFFSCPVWNGYNHLLLTMHYPYQKLGYLMSNQDNAPFIKRLTSYLQEHDIIVNEVEETRKKSYISNYLLTLSIKDKSPVYMIVSYWSGSGGIIGETKFDLYFNQKAARERIVDL